MHAIFISQCQNKGIARTAKILDAYALRKGDRTWITPITQDGLLAIRSQLRQDATRQMAVACYINETRYGGHRSYGMRLLWTVGNSSGFGPQGVVAVASRTSSELHRQRIKPLPEGLRMASLLARSSGYAHDFGKIFEMFQVKLRASTPQADAVRHEWISLQLLLHGLLVDCGSAVLGVGPGVKSASKSGEGVVDGQSSIASLDAGDDAGSVGSALECLGWDERWLQSCDFREVLDFDDLSNEVGLKGGLGSAWASFLYLVFTHHRLPSDAGSSRGSKDNKSSSGVLDAKTYVREDAPGHPLLYPRAMPSKQTLVALQSAYKRINAMQENISLRESAAASSLSSSPLSLSPLWWRSVASVARMALILADHSVSGIDVTQSERPTSPVNSAVGAPKAAVMYANTVLSNGHRRLNQELNWHLLNVGDEAGKMLSRMTLFSPPGLSEKVRLGLRKSAQQALVDPALQRFSWQARNARILEELQEKKRRSTLVFNIAGTGCGKTRANVLFVDALRQGQTMRIATGLNLRTLTLQTRDAYAKQLGMGEGDLSCVIGSAIAQHLHEMRDAVSTQKAGEAQTENSLEDEDGNLPEDEFEASGECDPPPPWLESFLAKKPKLRTIAMAPALVCTIDFLVKAGDPTQQGNQALTMLRLMRSDLILDEIDSYDPKALVAVMRLVTAAAMWGRHVIASSATLSPPVAKALWQAHDLGLSMGRCLGTVDDAPALQVLIDDANEASVASHSSDTDFHDWYIASIGQRCAVMGQRSLRPVELIALDVEDETSTSGTSMDAGVRNMRETVARHCQVMHERHKWTIELANEEDGQDDKEGKEGKEDKEGVWFKASKAPKPPHTHHVSFGFVRIANITQAVQMAQTLCESLPGRLPGVRIACYHAQLPRLQRHAMEVTLDGVLQRGDASLNNESRLSQHPGVMDAIRKNIENGLEDTCFIVVATPVEEVGRDHDFDWGIFEPSSTQSLVQAAGRVNRHRLVSVSEPNIAVLQFNAAKLAGREVCFSKPGLEDVHGTYGNQDLRTLVNWSAIEQAGQIDARLRYDTKSHAFAEFDDTSSARQIDAAARRFLKSDCDLWMGADTYKQVRLRESNEKQTWSRNEAGRFLLEERVGERGWSTQWRITGIQTQSAPANAWLYWSHAELISMAQELEVSTAEAFLTEARPPSSGRIQVFNEAFGYYLKTKD